MIRIPVWSWTDAVAKSDVPPLTKLVCLNIARYLSSAGTGWRITVEQMVRDTGMGDRAIRTHLAKAKKAGLLDITRHHDGRGHRTATEYRPRFPGNMVLTRQPAELPGLPARDAGRVSRRLPARDAGQVPFQERIPSIRKDSLRCIDTPAHARAAGADATDNPLSYWPDGGDE